MFVCIRRAYLMHGKSDAATYEKYVRLIHVKHILFKAFSRAFDQLQPAHDPVEQINPHLCHEIRTPVSWWPHTADMRVGFFFFFVSNLSRLWKEGRPQNLCTKCVRCCAQATKNVTQSCL